MVGDSGGRRYKYWAFISYSRHDRRIARWLRDGLVKSPSPKQARHTVADAGGKLDAIFLDQDEASAGASLGGELQEALEASRTLIVLCSPMAVASEHVANEIRHFQSLGRANQVLCLIVSGVPNATDEGKPAIEAFPAPLRMRPDGTVIPLGERPLAASLGDETQAEKRHALEQIVAGIHGVSPEHWRKRRAARTLGRTAIAASAMVLVAAAAGAYWVAYQFPAVSYASDAVRRNGIWTEAHAISAQDAQKRQSSFRFIRRGMMNPPTRVENVNGRGHCSSDGMVNIIDRQLIDHCSAARACAVEFTYDRSGAITSERMLDQFGNTMETLSYNAPSVGQFTEAGFGCSRSASGIQYVKFTRYDAGPRAGFDRKVEFFRNRAAGGSPDPRPNDNGAYALEYDLDERGWTEAVWSLGPDGARISGKGGYSGIRYKRRADGAVLHEEYLDPQGKLTINTNGFHQSGQSRDDAGNLLRIDYQDDKGAPAIHAKEWVTGQAYVYSAFGERVAETSFGADGKPMAGADGCVQGKFEFDRSGYQSASGCFDAAGKPAIGKDGVHLSRTVSLEGGAEADISFFDVDGKPAIVASDQDANGGYHRFTAAYDAKGNRTEQLFFGPDGKIAIDKQSRISGWRKSYNGANQVVEVTSLQADHKPGDGPKPGSIIRYGYDDRGNAITELYFDSAGKPVANPDSLGAYGMRFGYDELGNMISETVLDADGNPMMGTDGRVTAIYVLDSRGNAMTASFQDAAGKPISNSDGVHQIRFANDYANRLTEKSFFDLAGAPVTSKSGGMAKWTMALDARGKDVSQSFFGTDGKPSAGLALAKVTTDERGNVVGVAWLGADGSAFVSPDGSSGWRQAFDARENITLYYPIGPKGDRIALKDGTSGWRADYDIYDNRIRAVTLDINDKPINGKDGEATWEGDYDLYGNEIAHRSFDQNGKPINDPWNTYAYDAKGRVIRRQMVDVNSTPMLSPESKRSIVHYAYDDKGRIVEEASFGLKDEPLNRGDLGWHRITSAYAVDGSVTHKCFAVSGAPVTPCKSD